MNFKAGDSCSQRRKRKVEERRRLQGTVKISNTLEGEKEMNRKLIQMSCCWKCLKPRDEFKTLQEKSLRQTDRQTEETLPNPFIIIIKKRSKLKDEENFESKRGKA